MFPLNVSKCLCHMPGRSIEKLALGMHMFSLLLQPLAALAMAAHFLSTMSPQRASQWRGRQLQALITGGCTGGTGLYTGATGYYQQVKSQYSSAQLLTDETSPLPHHLDECQDLSAAFAKLQALRIHPNVRWYQPLKGCTKGVHSKCVSH